MSTELTFALLRGSCRAPDNLLSPSQLRSLLKDIREIRQAKLRTAIIPQIGEEGTGLNGEYLQVNLSLSLLSSLCLEVVKGPKC